VIDFGCGLGQFTRAMARAAGRGAKVVGIERNEQQVHAARELAAAAGEAELVEFRQGAVLSPPLQPGEPSSFDVAHARFLLEPVRDPLAVVRVMAGAVRPGGRIVLADDDHEVLRIWPEVPGFYELWSAYMNTYSRLGNDPGVGRRLVELLHRAGVTPVRTTWVWFGGCAGEPVFVPLVENLVGLVQSARAAILENGALSARTLDATLDAVRAWGQRDDAALWFSVCWAQGTQT
jgi:SAM-dependent methyltransferase